MKQNILELAISLLQFKLEYHKNEYDKTYINIQELQKELKGIKKWKNINYY